MRISDWSSDVCSSDLSAAGRVTAPPRPCPALPAGCRVTDPFGDPLHTARQRAYAARLRLPTIYTPQMVIDGIDQVVGSRQSEIEATIRRHLALGRAARVTIPVRAGRRSDGPVTVFKIGRAHV